MLLARMQGACNVVGGIWPLLHLPSFEAVFGPKTDRWLVRTVAALLVANGWTQLRTPPSADGLAQARRLGVGTALSLGAIDVRYGLPGRISRRYLADAVLEATWIAAWLASGRAARRRARLTTRRTRGRRGR
jgi:hypothetical protein